MSIEKKLKGALEKLSKEDFTFNTDKFKDINRAENSHMFKDVYRFPAEGSFDEPIRIIPLSDIHLGSKQCNLAKVRQAIDLIMETPNCYTVLMGDQTETATKTSVGMATYDEDFCLEDQIRLIVKMLKPLADAGKILGCLVGNHEMRVAYSTSLNIVKMIARELKINYLGFQGYLSIHVGEQSYSIMVAHGKGGASTPAGKLRAMRNLSKVAEADLYLSGHTHGRIYDYDLKNYIDEEEDIVKSKRIIYAVCGSFLEYWDGYAEMKLLSPSSTGVISITLDAEEKNIDIMI